MSISDIWLSLSTKSIRLDNRATKLGLERRLADAPTAPDPAASETNSFTVDPIFIGRDNDVSKIVGMLRTPTEQALSILPIVGMGGLGKTTLARKIFHHEKISTYFGLHIWVHVSPNFDAMALLKKIHKYLQGGSVEEVESREVVLKKLREALGSKTYLLVLDDVWNQDRKKWAGFINSWSGISSIKGNCILVMTRNTEVGSIVNTLGIHHLNGLSKEECWTIIKDRAFKGGDVTQGIEAIGTSIAGRCGGLPLAANVVGDVLRDKSQDEWLYNAAHYDHIMFSDFKSLHVLLLMNFGKELHVLHLRYLNISPTSVETLPDSIGELYHLQTFRARNWILKKLPSTFKYLLNLRHLHLHDRTELPPHLGMLTSLQTLTCYKVGNEDGHRIVELACLKNLKGKLKIDNLENVQGEAESNKACLFEKPGILRLVLRWGERRESEINDESVLKGLQPHTNLKILEIFGFKGANFPSWTLKMEGFNSLMEIKVEECVECEEIPSMGHLPCLKSVYLRDLKNVKSISRSFYGIDSCGSNNIVFPALERLELIDMPNLREWVEVGILNAGAQV